jgi:hypothetical protein
MTPQPSIGYTHIPVTTNTNKAFNCNRLTLINKGTIDATIDGKFVLSPGQSITYPAWPGEVNRTVYNITFQSGVNGALVIAICKNENWK